MHQSERIRSKEFFTFPRTGLKNLFEKLIVWMNLCVLIFCFRFWNVPPHKVAVEPDPKMHCRGPDCTRHSKTRSYNVTRFFGAGAGDPRRLPQFHSQPLRRSGQILQVQGRPANLR